MVAQEGPPTLAGWIVSFDHRAARAFARAFDPDRHCPVCVRQPRVRDRAGADCERIRFSQNILPRYARRTKSFEALIPILYLKGVSKNPPSFRGGYLKFGMHASTIFIGTFVPLRKTTRLLFSKTNLPEGIPRTYAFKIAPCGPQVKAQSPLQSNSLIRIVVPLGPGGPGGPCSPLSPFAICRSLHAVRTMQRSKTLMKERISGLLEL
jgi:hypothetical protein